MSRESFYCRALHSHRLLGYTRRPVLHCYIYTCEGLNIFFDGTPQYIHIYIYVCRGGDAMVVETGSSVHYKYLMIIRYKKDLVLRRRHRLFFVRLAK